jgi:hypothetical protein
LVRPGGAKAVEFRRRRDLDQSPERLDRGLDPNFTPFSVEFQVAPNPFARPVGYIEIALKLSVSIAIGGRSLIRVTATGYSLVCLNAELYSCISINARLRQFSCGYLFKHLKYLIY